jgi:uncharacterized membrane protein
MPRLSFQALLQAALLVSYLLCCHIAVTRHHPQLQLAALLLLGLGLSLKGLLEYSKFSWTLMLVLAGGAIVINTLGLAHYVLYVPPIILPLLLWSVFFRSLLPGQTPLVTRIAMDVRGSLSHELQRYTRSVTVLWSGLFALLAIGSALLPIVASPHVWSLFTNLLNYLFIAALFIAEFLYRRWHFKEIEHTRFLQYLRTVIRADVRKFR